MASGSSTSEFAASGAREFRTTHWSVVLAAGDSASPHAAVALEELCRTYSYPLYAFIRRQGHAPHDAEDLTQEFFARLLKRRFLQSVDPRKGKFRSFLLAWLKNFLANEWDRARTLKRGGQYSFISWDQEVVENRYRAEPSHEVTPDRIFERAWALTVLEKALEELRNEYAAANKTELFDTLQECLSGEKGEASYADVMPKLRMSEGAVKMSVLRMRRRYGELLRSEIAQTVTSTKELEEEMRQLFAVLSG